MTHVNGHLCNFEVKNHLLPKILHAFWEFSSHTLMCLINGGGLIIVLALENRENNRPKTKNYITDGHKKISKQEVDPPRLLGT